MNTVSERNYFDIQEIGHEEYEYASDEEVMRISRDLIIKHEEAYRALANA